MPESRCGVGANHFIESLFQDCVYNFRDHLGFFVGLASILTWIVAQLPQIISNIRNKSAEALSAWFLAEWLMGDTCNLIGCLLTGSQLVTQTYTAAYFICADIVLVMQYTYYGTLQQRRQRSLRNQQYRLQHLEDGSFPPTSALEGTSNRLPLISQLGSAPKPRAVACLGLVFLSSQFLQSSQQQWSAVDSGGRLGRLLLSKGDPDWTLYVGQSLGWVSSALYLGSRVAQIYKNWSRQSAEGLSIAMFACAITANVLYGLGILLRTYHWSDLAASAPWLLGSLGTVFLDVIIYLQFSWYQGKTAEAQEADGLLAEESRE